MALIDLKNIRLSFGGPPILDGVDLVIEPGERVYLLGRNGEGVIGGRTIEIEYK